MANFGLIHFGMIAHVFIQDMNYQCANFYTNISTNMDTTNIFPYLVIFSVYCKRGNFRVGVIFAFFALLSSSRKLPPRENKTHMPL